MFRSFSRILSPFLAILIFTLPAVASAEKGMLILTSDPGGAKIYINGKRKGTTPTQRGKDLVFYLKEGEYRIEAVIDGRGTLKASENVFVSDDSIQPIHLKLQREIAMVRIPAGRFRMGCVSGLGCNDDETPVHQVSIQAFEMSQYEVTFDEWDACVADGGCSHKPDDEGWGRGSRPVINVSWDDIQEYLAWLNQKTGKRYRLPSEAEWEYAARAGSEKKYTWGNEDPVCRKGARNGAKFYDNAGCDRTGTEPVGFSSANAFGLYDMHGNVWEWVADCWNDSYQGAPGNGRPWLKGNCQRRVLRGGSWVDYPRSLRSANRSGFSTVDRDDNYGFRVARTLTP